MHPSSAALHPSTARVAPFRSSPCAATPLFPEVVRFALFRVCARSPVLRLPLSAFRSVLSLLHSCSTTCLCAFCFVRCSPSRAALLDRFPALFGISEGPMHRRVRSSPPTESLLFLSVRSSSVLSCATIPSHCFSHERPPFGARFQLGPPPPTPPQLLCPTRFRLQPLQLLNSNDYLGPLKGIVVTKFNGAYTQSQWKVDVKIPNSGKGQMMLHFLRFRDEAERSLVADAIRQYLASQRSLEETEDARNACEGFIHELLAPYELFRPSPMRLPPAPFYSSGFLAIVQSCTIVQTRRDVGATNMQPDFGRV